MKRLGAGLAILMAVAGWAAGQLDPPRVPPAPTVPLTETPETLPPLRVTLPEPADAPEAQSPVASIRVPTQFTALYNSPSSRAGTIDPSALRRGGGCASCESCEPVGRVWGEIDYIYWRARGDDLPALVTASPAGTPPAQAGVLGAAGVRILGGASSFGDEDRSGLRYNFGVWLDPGNTFGLQAGGFFLDDRATSAAFSSSGDPILAHPFNAVTGLPSSQLIAFPEVLAGSIAVDHRNAIRGFDAALRSNMCCAADWRLDVLFGYRYLRIEDGLAISESLVAGPLAPGSLAVPSGSNIIVVDRFNTSNTFHGVQVGMAGEYRLRQGWFVSGACKASLGWLDRVADIAGGTTLVLPGQTAVPSVGGLLALSSNIGHDEQSDGVILPELSLNLGYEFTRNFRIRAGYNFLYIGSVIRTGTIIDTAVNPGLIPPPTGSPTPARPIGQTERSDFILHGINATLELRY